jgi:membrane associated rhomboid family serine protease
MNEFQLLMASPATIALLVSNTILSIAALGNDRLFEAMMFDVGRIRRDHEYHRLLTSGFIHAGPIHLFMNMFTLFSFGPVLERALQTWAFLAVYLACLVFGSLWSLLEHVRNMGYRAVGASGAVIGVTTLFSMFAPMAEVQIMGILPMPAILATIVFVFLLAYAAQDIRTGIIGRIGHSAHVGGALMGIVLACVFWPLGVRNGWESILTALRL